MYICHYQKFHVRCSCPNLALQVCMRFDGDQNLDMYSYKVMLAKNLQWFNKKMEIEAHLRKVHGISASKREKDSRRGASDSRKRLWCLTFQQLRKGEVNRVFFYVELNKYNTSCQLYERKLRMRTRNQFNAIWR